MNICTYKEIQPLISIYESFKSIDVVFKHFGKKKSNLLPYMAKKDLTMVTEVASRQTFQRC